MRSKWLRIAASALALGLIGAGVAKADVLDDIKKKGTLTVRKEEIDLAMAIFDQALREMKDKVSGRIRPTIPLTT